jgi:hypothetical protein
MKMEGSHVRFRASSYDLKVCVRMMAVDVIIDMAAHEKSFPPSEAYCDPSRFFLLKICQKRDEAKLTKYTRYPDDSPGVVSLQSVCWKQSWSWLSSART